MKTIIAICGAAGIVAAATVAYSQSTGTTGSTTPAEPTTSQSSTGSAHSMPSNGMQSQGSTYDPTGAQGSNSPMTPGSSAGAYDKAPMNNAPEARAGMAEGRSDMSGTSGSQANQGAGQGPYTGSAMQRAGERG